MIYNTLLLLRKYESRNGRKHCPRNTSLLLWNRVLHLKLKVEIETIDTLERKSITCLVDSGVTSEFIDQDYAKSCRFNLVKLKQPILVYNADGTLNEAGSIAEVVHLILRHKNHLERTVFAVTGLRKQKLLLGHSWLQNHNPEIDWVKGEVKMSRCPPCCCSGCWDELRQERIV